MAFLFLPSCSHILRVMSRVLMRTRMQWRRSHRRVRGLGTRWFVWTVPHLQERTPEECGLACVVMLLRYHGCWRTMAECRQMAGVREPNGLAVIATARRLGFHVQSWVAPSPEVLRQCASPVMAYWCRSHYIVVVRVTGTRAIIIDPLVGRRSVSHDEFRSCSGLVLTLEPASGFERVSRRRHTTLRAWIRMLPSVWRTRRLRVSVALLLGISVTLHLLLLAVPAVVLLTIEHAIPGRSWHALSWLAIGMAFLSLAHVSLRQARAQIVLNVQADAESWLRRQLVAAAIHLPIDSSKRAAAADLLLCASGAGVFRDQSLIRSVSIALDSLIVITALPLVAWWSWRIALLFLAVAFAQALMMLCGQSVLSAALQRDPRAMKAVRLCLANMSTGARAFEVAGDDDKTMSGWPALVRRRAHAARRRQVIGAALENGLSGMRVLGIGLFLSLGATEVMVGHLRMSQLLALQTIVLVMFLAMESCVAMVQEWPELWRRVERLRKALNSIRVPPDIHRLPDAPAPLDIVFDRVCFRYGRAPPEVVSNLSFVLRAGSEHEGQVVAVVGRSGAGKSTLMRLIAGLDRPDRGEISIAGVPLTLLDRTDLHRRLCTVLPEDVLFNCSLRDNITLGRPHVEESDVETACRLMELDQEMAPAILDAATWAGAQQAEAPSDSGRTRPRLSTGQRQRVLLARALAGRPSVLVLDDAMSHLDGKTTARLLRRIRQRVSLTIVCAHRLGSVREADLILVLDEGRLAQRGRHDELVVVDGEYARLVG